MNLYSRPGSHSAAILAASACALSASRNSSTNCIAGAASASSILDSANPTWISTHSPGLGGSSDSRPMLISRLTPLTSTLARSGCSGCISMTSPGMPRHMGHLQSCDGEFPEHLVDRGLRLLDPVDRGGRRHEQVVDAVKFGHLAALVAGQPDGEHPAPARLVERGQRGHAAARV